MKNAVCKRPPGVRAGERGSALLIVFLFAAVLAISLYMEMPSVAFEAKRAKEQLLIDRGNEYAHAVKLYYRKFRTYPGSIEALENTNRMRFLRHKFKDPMTGEDNWRLLHAGPGGQLTDSKVNPIGLTQNGKTPASNNNSAGNSSGSSFGNNSAGSSFMGNATAANASSNSSFQSFTSNSPTNSTVAAVPQRPPEMPVNGGAATNPANVDPTQSLVSDSSANSSTQPPGFQTQNPQVQPIPTQPNQAQPNQTQRNPVQAGPVPFNMGQPIPTQSGTAAANVPPLAGMAPIPGQQVAPVPANTGADMSSPMQGVQGLMNNPNPATPPGTPAAPVPAGGAAPASGGSSTSTFGSTTQSNSGVLQSGGIAGVASVAKGTTIKTVNDQTDYALWEFYYDPTKDTSTTGQSGINPQSGVARPNATGTPASTGFGSTTTPSTTAPTTPMTPPTTSGTPPGIIPRAPSERP